MGSPARRQINPIMRCWDQPHYGYAGTDDRRGTDQRLDTKRLTLMSGRYSRLRCRLIKLGRQVLVGRDEFVPPRFGVTVFPPGEVSSEVLGVDLPPGPVEGNLVQRHSAYLDRQVCPVADRGQGDLDGRVVGRDALTALVGLVGLAGGQLEPPGRLACVHPSRALDVVGLDVGAELSSRTEVAFDPAVPPGEAGGIGECRPQVLDVGVVSVFDADDTRSVCRAQVAEDAASWTCVAAHLALLRSCFPRAISVCKASSRRSHCAR